MGQPARAEEQWRLVVREVPKYRPAWRGLGEMLLLQGKLDEALAVSDHLCGPELIADRRDQPAGSLQTPADHPCRHDSLRSEGMILRGRALAARGDIAAARHEFEQAVAGCPNDLEPLQALCRLLFEHADPDDAREAIEGLLRRDPQDAAAYHNLGSVRYRLGQYEASADAYRQSLQLRPSSASTYLHLGYALREAGRLPEARTAWQQALRLAPGQPNATGPLRLAMGGTD
jgi:tetratricopeptide (TPR) repeat protein